MTPAEAKKAGANAIVVGRPITEAASPRKSAEIFLQELS
jgi:orotidine-5'-phosphate decarboxylase